MKSRQIVDADVFVLVCLIVTLTRYAPRPPGLQPTVQRPEVLVVRTSVESVRHLPLLLCWMVKVILLPARFAGVKTAFIAN